MLKKLYVLILPDAERDCANVAVSAIRQFDRSVKIAAIRWLGPELSVDHNYRLSGGIDVGGVLECLKAWGELHGYEAFVCLDPHVVISRPVPAPEKQATFGVYPFLFSLRAEVLRELLGCLNWMEQSKSIVQLYGLFRTYNQNYDLKKGVDGWLTPYCYDTSLFVGTGWQNAQAVWVGEPATSNCFEKVSDGIRVNAMGTVFSHFSGNSTCCLPPAASVTSEHPRKNGWRIYDAFAHRTGWPVIVDALQQRLGERPPGFEDFMEAAFMWDRMAGEKLMDERQWVGISHNPRGDHPLARRALYQPWDFMRSAMWKICKDRLKTLVVLSEHHARQLRSSQAVSCKIVVLKHPTTCNHPQWLPSAWEEGHVVLSSGQWLRNTELLHQVPLPSPFHPVILRKRERHWQTWNEKILGNPKLPNVEERMHVNNEEYDALLASSVVVTELYDASANNVVLETIVRATPHLVNRHPAAEEYLGESYPGFWDSKEEIASMLADKQRVSDCHVYLLERRKEPWLAIDFFVGEVAKIVGECLS